MRRNYSLVYTNIHQSIFTNQFLKYGHLSLQISQCKAKLAWPIDAHVMINVKYKHSNRTDQRAMPHTATCTTKPVIRRNEAKKPNPTYDVKDLLFFPGRRRRPNK